MGKHPPASDGRVKGGGDKNNIWFDIRKEGDGFSIERFVIYADIVTSEFKTFEMDYNNGYWDESLDTGNKTFIVKK